MRPDQRWFPTNRNARAGWFRNFSTAFAEVGISLGFTQDEIDSVAADAAMLQYTARALTSLEAAVRSARAFERSVTGGRNNGGRAEFPAITLPPMPPMVDSGIYERLDRTVRRIRLSAAYTSTVGASLNIIPTERGFARGEEFVPRIKTVALASAYTFTVRSPKLHFDGMLIDWKPANAAVWQSGGRFFNSPANVTIKPPTPGQPEQIMVRVRMLKGDTPVTAYSPADTVTVNP